MTMTGPDPILIEIMVAFIFGAIFGVVVVGILLGIGATSLPPHCGVCLCP
jgi:hypothetical protein